MGKIAKKLQIVVFHWTEDNRTFQKLYLQGIERWTAYDLTDNTEDTALARCMASCTQVARLLQEAVKYDEAEYHFIELPCDIDDLTDDEFLKITAELNWGC